ncbi:MAG TPA: DUF1800 domain-containing protein [Blastocatellia bacterium]|nr:DUF1800 domain-containing protein [Blastocatellia bacterium]
MKKTTFKFMIANRSTVALAMIAVLAFSAMVPVVADTKPKSTRALTEEQKIVHLLNRTGFGARPGDIERVRAMGIEKYLDQQLHPERINDSATEARLKRLESLNMTIAEIYEKYPQPNLIANQLGIGKKQQAKQNEQMNPNSNNQADDVVDLSKRENRQAVMAYYREHGLKLPAMLLGDLMEQKIIRGVYSERQLQEVLTDFWFNHFNIFYAKGADRWLTTDYEMNAIRPRTLGKFKDLLMATAKSPAMLFYLDNFQSSSPDAKLPERRGQGRFQRRLGNQQQGQTAEQQRRRQAAQQFRNRKPGINENYARELMELHTLGVEGGYTQKDVQEVARCFTGWTINQPRREGSFIFRSWMHDDGEKTVLGKKIPAGGGMRDGEMVIDLLVHHPNTAKFISTKLVRRFVSDNPPQSLVDRVSSVYMKTDGDISEMLRAIFASPEFNSQEAYRAKIKSPFELAVSAIRALGGEATNTIQVAQFIAKMGQPLYRYQPPTGFPDRAEQWVNTGSLLERLNFGLALATNKLRGTNVDLKRVAPNVNSNDQELALDRAIALLLSNDVSTQTRSVLDKQLREGVPVKGVLDNSPDAMKSNGQMDDDVSLLADDSNNMQRKGKGDKVAKYDDPNRQARRFGLGNDSSIQLRQGAANDPEIAKAFGLVLGSPEFQRR